MKDREKAFQILERETGLTKDCLPDGIPLEDFVNEEGELDYDAISGW